MHRVFHEHRRELRLSVLGDDTASLGQHLLDDLVFQAKERGLDLPASYEGVRINVPDQCWRLLRLSLHDPLMPLNLDGDAVQDLESLTTLAYEMLR